MKNYVKSSNQPTDRQTDIRAYREVKLPIMIRTYVESVGSPLVGCHNQAVSCQNQAVSCHNQAVSCLNQAVGFSSSSLDSGNNADTRLS